MTNSDEIIISEQQFFDYMRCPAFYCLKHERGMDFPEKVSIPKLLTKTMNYFFTILQGGRFPTVKEVQRKWDSLCLEHKSSLDPGKVISGWNRMMIFMDWVEKRKILVGGVCVPYNIEIKNVTLSGVIDTILVNPELHKIELFYPNFSTKTFTENYLNNNVKYTIDAYAFKTIYDGDVSGITTYDPKKEWFKYTFRTVKDYAKLRTNIYNIGNAIKNKCYYTRECVLCDSCPASKYCKYFNMEI